MQQGEDRSAALAAKIAEVEHTLSHGDLDRAAALAQRIIGCGAAHAVLFEARGLGLMQAGRRKEALDDLRRAHSLAPKTARILVQIATCLNTLGRPREGLLACGDALAVEEGLAAAWFQKGLAHRQLAHPAKAEECFRRAICHDPALEAVYEQCAAAPFETCDKARASEPAER